MVTRLGSEGWDQSVVIEEETPGATGGYIRERGKPGSSLRDFAVGPFLLQGKSLDCGQRIGLTLFSG